MPSFPDVLSRSFPKTPERPILPPFMRLLTLRSFPKPIRLLALCTVLLFALFGAGFFSLWRTLPVEGIKLHANIDTGVDLLGTRAEFGWLAGIAVTMVVGNTLLAARLRSSQPAAAVMFLAATALILIGFLGVLLFIARLNFRFTP